MHVLHNSLNTLHEPIDMGLEQSAPNVPFFHHIPNLAHTVPNTMYTFLEHRTLIPHS